jgi:hypothetical protein
VKQALWKAFGSFVAVVVGWSSGLLAIAAFASAAAVRGDLPWSQVLVGVGGYFILIGIFVLPIWLFSLLPLYVLLPSTSRLWRTPICTALGLAIGTSIMFAYLGMGGLELPVALWQITFTGALVGGVTCFFGARTASYFRGTRTV